VRTSDLLRAATAAEHKAAEVRLDAASILNGSLSEAGFADMIRIHYGVWSAVAYWWPEDAASEPQARNFLTEMVAQLRRDIEVIGTAPPALPSLSLDVASAATRYGALYVLRGSTLGGTLISRKLKSCEALKKVPAFHFHTACESLPGKEWPAYLRELNAKVQAEREQTDAVAGAKAVFNMYLG